MEKTQLLFFVTAARDHWVVQSEGMVYGPFDSYPAAFDRAVAEARAAGLYGFASAVLVRSRDGGPARAGWSFDRDHLLPVLQGALH